MLKDTANAPSMADMPEAALSRVRVFCDEGIRYYTWALQRMPSIPEQAAHVGRIEERRLGLAHVLAFVEGAADNRTGLAWNRTPVGPRPSCPRDGTSSSQADLRDTGMLRRSMDRPVRPRVVVWDIRSRRVTGVIRSHTA